MRASSNRLTLLAVVSLAGALVVAPTTASAVASKGNGPTCSSVGLPVIRQALGGSPRKPTQQTSANVLICHYTTVDLIFLLHQNKALFKADEKSNKGTSVFGIGSSAFTYGAKGSAISLEVLTGTVAVVVSGSSAGLKKIEAFARRLVVLI